MTTHDPQTFDTWLDDFVAGRSTPATGASDASTGTLTEATRQFHGLARHAEASVPVLNAIPRWEHVMTTHQSSTASIAPPQHGVPSPPGRSALTWPHRGPFSRRGVQIGLNLTLVALLLFTLAAGIWRFRSVFGDGNDNSNQIAYQPTTNPAAASPEASSDDQPISWGGNNGHTSQYFVPIPSIDSLVPRTVALDQRLLTYGFNASGNTVVSVGSFSESNYGDQSSSQMWATNLTSGEVLWERRQAFGPNFAIANGTIYAVHLSENSSVSVATLVALDLATGEPRAFDGPVIPVIESGMRIGPLVVGNTVYVADSLGTTIAVDAVTGQELWRTQGDRGDTPPPSRTNPGASGGALAASDGALYVVTAAHHVRRLDFATGKILFEIDVTTEHEGPVWNVALYATKRQLVARISGALATPGVDDGSVQMIPETVAILDPGSGKVKQTHQYAEISGDLALANGMVFVPNRLSLVSAINLDVFPVVGNGTVVLENVTTARTMDVAIAGLDGSAIFMLDSDGWLYGATFSGRMEQVSDLMEIGNIQSVSGERDPLPILGTGNQILVHDGAGRLMSFGPSTNVAVDPGLLPQAKDCTVEPLTVDDVIAIMQDPDPSNGMDPLPADGSEVPVDGYFPGMGSPSQNVIDQVGAALSQWYACQLGGSWFQIWALETPAKVQATLRAAFPGMPTEDEVRTVLETLQSDPISGPRVLSNPARQQDFAMRRDVVDTDPENSFSAYGIEVTPGYVTYNPDGTLLAQHPFQNSATQTTTYVFVRSEDGSRWLLASQPSGG